jgi:hypothetical protein
MLHKQHGATWAECSNDRNRHHATEAGWIGVHVATAGHAASAQSCDECAGTMAREESETINITFQISESRVESGCVAIVTIQSILIAFARNKQNRRYTRRQKQYHKAKQPAEVRVKTTLEAVGTENIEVKIGV